MNQPNPSCSERPSNLTRRTVFTGAGVAAAAVAAASLLPGSQQESLPVAAEIPSHPVEGYRLTEHVKRYYQTAKV